MSAIIAAWMPLAKLKEIVETLEARDEKGFKMTIGLNDDSDKFGQNVQLFAEQTKEQRDAKQDRYFCGNGRVIWTNGKIILAEKKEKTEAESKTKKTTAKDEAPF